MIPERRSAGDPIIHFIVRDVKGRGGSPENSFFKFSFTLIFAFLTFFNHNPTFLAFYDWTLTMFLPPFCSSMEDKGR